jgi:DNA repair protein RadC
VQRPTIAWGNPTINLKGLLVMSFWTVSDAPAAAWSEQRALTEPRSAAIAELVSVITGCDLIKAAQVVEAVTMQASLFTEALAWNRFRSATGQELTNAGLTEKQAAKLMSALEFGKRVFASYGAACPVIDDGRVAAELLRYEIGESDVEKFAVIVLDIKHKVIAVKVIAVGTKTECLAHPAEIFAAVLKVCGSRMIVAHNHPSGSINPSAADLSLTKNLLKASSMMATS